MWHNSKDVKYVYTTHGSQTAYAIVSDVAGWKRIKADSTDGVSNVATLLSVAKAHGRKVNVYIDSDQITRALAL